MPQALLEKLTEYKQVHQLESVAQAAVAILLEFFKLESDQPNLLLNNTNLLQRIEQIEHSIQYLTNQFASEEHKNSISLSAVKRDGVNRTETQQSNNYFSIAQLAETSDVLQSISTNNVSAAADRSQAQFNNSHFPQAATTLSIEAWTEGLTTNDLIGRLRTNPSTLKKYLRDLNQTQWAVQRDPNGLGWVYDPLLERYYPIEVSATNDASTVVSAPSNSDASELLKSPSTENISFVSKLNSVEYKRLEYRGGLTQSQLSRLTKIPINTLQRWKQMPDCCKRIQCRTEGAYAYSYFEQHQRFYPSRSSSS